MITVREATLEDLDVLLIMEQGVVTAERPFDSSLKNEGVKYYDIKDLINSPESSLVVATVNEQVVASGYATIRESKEYVLYSKYAYLGFMYVLPEHRGKGINALILKALSSWSKSQNVTNLKLDVYIKNVAAIKAYKKLNFKNCMVEMRLDLNQ